MKYINLSTTYNVTGQYKMKEKEENKFVCINLVYAADSVSVQSYKMVYRYDWIVYELKFQARKTKT